MFRFLRKLLAGLLGFAGWLVESCWDGWRGKSSAAERAQRVVDETAEQRAETKRKADEAHKATLEALATETLAATVDVAETLKAAVAAPPVDVMAERRARQARFAAEHATATEVRSSWFVDAVVEYDPEDGLTWRPA